MRKLKKIIEYGLYLLAFLLPIQTRLIVRAGEINGGVFEYGTVSLYGVDILIMLLFCLFVVYRLREKNQEKKSIDGIWFFIAGLELIIFVSLFFASDKVVAIYKYVLFMIGVGLFWMLQSVVYDKIKLLYAFVFGAIIQACLGVGQFFLQKTFALKWLGMAEHSPFGLGDSVIESLVGGRWLRAYGGLDHPNIFGGYLVFALLFIVYFSAKNKSKKEFGENLIGLFILSASCFLFWGIFLSFSRSSWLALFASLIAVVSLVFYKKNFQKQYNLFKNIFVVLVLGMIFISIFSELIITRFSNEARLEQKSYVERVESIKTAKVVIQDNWLFGVGVGNYTQYVHEKLHRNLDFWDYQPVHNVFLLVWAEIGVFGLFFYVALIFYSLLIILKSKNYLFIGIIISLLILFMFDHWFWSLHFGVILFWFLMGILFNKSCRVLNRKI